MSLAQFLRRNVHSDHVPHFLAPDSPDSCSSSGGSCRCFQVTVSQPGGCCCDDETITNGCFSENSLPLLTGNILSANARAELQSCPVGGASSGSSSNSAGESQFQDGLSGIVPIDCCDDRPPTPGVYYFQINDDTGLWQNLSGAEFSIDEIESGFQILFENGDTDLLDADGVFISRTLGTGDKIIQENLGSVPGQGNQTQKRLCTTRDENGVSVTDDVLTTFQDTGAGPRPMIMEHQRTTGSEAPTSVSRVIYTYYESGDPHGDEGMLLSDTTQIYNADTDQWEDVKTQMYRYDPSNGLLRYVLHADGFADLVADPNVSDPFTAPDSIVAQYADGYFEYDELDRLTTRQVHGGLRSYTYEYEENTYPDDFNYWRYKLDETLPGGNHRITFANHADQPIVEISQAADDPTEQVVNFYQYNEQGKRTLHAHPSAIVDIDQDFPDMLKRRTDGTFELLRDDDGLIEINQYDPDSGKLVSQSVKKGQHGTEIKQREIQYIVNQEMEQDVYFPAKEIQYPSEADATQTIVTEYEYTFHAGTATMATRTTRLPVISAQQNGTGTVNTIDEVFDAQGRLVWQRDPRGYIQYTCYDISSGSICQRIQDADTSQLTAVPAGWQTPADGGQHIVTDYQYDAQDRVTQMLGPVHLAMVDDVQTSVRTANWTIHNDVANTTMSARGYAHGANMDQFTLVNPVQIAVRNPGDHVVAEISAVRAVTNGKLSADDTFNQGDYVRWTTHNYDECCLRESTRVYHDIPATGDGDSGTHYNETKFGYDEAKNMNRTVSPSGTIRTSVFNKLSQVTATYIGTNDNGATDSDPTGSSAVGSGAAGNDMVLLAQSTYNDDGQLVQTTVHVDDETTRVTEFEYDYRGRQTIVNGEMTQYTLTHYDNANRVISVDRRDTNAAGNLVSRNEMLYDDNGRPFQQIQHGVDPNTGALTGETLVQSTVYDAAGNAIKQFATGQIIPTQRQYDSLGRVVKTTDQLGHVSTVTYNDAGQATESTNQRGKTSRRYYDAVGRQIKTETPLGATNEFVFDDAANQIATIDALGYQSGVTYDAAGRQISVTTPQGNTTSFAYDADGNRISVTDALGFVTSYQYDLFSNQTGVTDPVGSFTQSLYNRVGEQIESIDAKGNSTLQEYDGLGRLAITTDRIGGVTSFAYTPAGQLASLTDAENQTTSYTFDAFGREHETIYPDHVTGTSPGDDDYGIVTMQYDAQSRLLRMTDQLGDTVTYHYDDAGRLLQRDYRTAANSPSGSIADSDVFTYDAGGLILTAVSGRYNNTVTQVYDDVGRMTGQSLSIDGQTYNVGTLYNARGQVAGYTYPDGKQVTRSYHADGQLHEVQINLRGQAS